MGSSSIFKWMKDQQNHLITISPVYWLQRRTPVHHGKQLAAFERQKDGGFVNYTLKEYIYICIYEGKNSWDGTWTMLPCRPARSSSRLSDLSQSAPTICIRVPVALICHDHIKLMVIFWLLTMQTNWSVDGMIITLWLSSKYLCPRIKNVQGSAMAQLQGALQVESVWRVDP